MPTPPTASPLVLASAPGAALWLSSRTAYPAYVEVLAARNNPWFSGCPQVRVELWTVGLATTGQQPRKLDEKTFQLVDAWFDSWEEALQPWASNLDCKNTTTLSPGAYTGPVVFLLCEPDGSEIARSTPITIAALPTGAATDEQPGIFDPIIDAGGNAARQGMSLLKLATITGIVVGGLILAPEIRAVIGGVRGHE